MTVPVVNGFEPVFSQVEVVFGILGNARYFRTFGLAWRRFRVRASLFGIVGHHVHPSSRRSASRSSLEANRSNSRSSLWSRKSAIISFVVGRPKRTSRVAAVC